MIVFVTPGQEVTPIVYITLTTKSNWRFLLVSTWTNVSASNGNHWGLLGRKSSVKSNEYWSWIATQKHIHTHIHTQSNTHTRRRPNARTEKAMHTYLHTTNRHVRRPVPPIHQLCINVMGRYNQISIKLHQLAIIREGYNVYYLTVKNRIAEKLDSLPPPSVRGSDCTAAAARGGCEWWSLTESDTDVGEWPVRYIKLYYLPSSHKVRIDDVCHTVIKCWSI